MLFPTGIFVAFFVVVFAVSWALVRRPSLWRGFIVIASYFFYSFWGWRYAFLLAGYTLVDYLLGRALAASSRGRGWLLALAVVLNLVPLVVFKYYGFLAFNTSEVAGWLGLGSSLPLLELVVPVGISFTTFRGISYVVDVYRNGTEKASLLDLAVFMSFFPYLAAGPIARTSELLPQIKPWAGPRRIDASRALYLIALGLTKKLVIGDFLARNLVDGVFAAPGQYSSLDVVLGIHAYAVQIYCDFSGYTDMAIGIALLLGILLPVNFDRPYTAVSLRDFWRRWHITLSRWLRDYLYIPMGGSRRSSLAIYRNLIITMVLAGLWHGAGWTFLVWGALHGVGMVFEHASAARRKKRGLQPVVPSGFGIAVRRVLTLEFVCLAWIFFRADSVTAAGQVIARTFTAWDVAPTVSWLVVLAIVAGIGLQYLPARLTEWTQALISRRRPLVQGLVFGLVVFAVVGLLGAEGVTNFIYIGF
ncbi:MAG: MBOAT family protein [Actinobacteria bacterium]|nr:MBOAT family protein [Actinomycetota bacterium]